MTDDPNDTNPATTDSPEVQWLLTTAKARHEQRMEHAAQEPAVAEQWLSDIERKERERRTLEDFARYVAGLPPDPSMLLALVKERAKQILDGLS